jgi:hypothetical protein
MVVMARETWTDERLDDLKGQMIERFDQADADIDRRFVQVDQRFDRVDGEVKEGFARVDKEMKEGFARVDGDIRELRGDVKEMQRLMVQGFIGICTLMGTGFAITMTGIGILAL